jgi:hypothetical protein
MPSRLRPLPAGFVVPCLPTGAPTAALRCDLAAQNQARWLPGHRPQGRQTGALYSRPGNDLTHRFPLIVQALGQLRPHRGVRVLASLSQNRQRQYSWNCRSVMGRAMTPIPAAAILIGANRTRSDVMDQEAIRAEIRLWTLEAFVCELFSLWCSRQEAPGATFVKLRDRMKIAARERTFGEVHPAMSDHLSAELESAVERLTDIGRRQLKAHLSRSQWSEFRDALKRDQENEDGS